MKGGKENEWEVQQQANDNIDKFNEKSWFKYVDKALGGKLMSMTPEEFDAIKSEAKESTKKEIKALIREKRQPEPYKGKGIRYKDEVVRRKEGKKASK